MKILKAHLNKNHATDEVYVDLVYRHWFWRRRIHVYFNPLMVVKIKP